MSIAASINGFIHQFEFWRNHWGEIHFVENIPFVNRRRERLIGNAGHFSLAREHGARSVTATNIQPLAESDFSAESYFPVVPHKFLHPSFPGRYLIFKPSVLSVFKLPAVNVPQKTFFSGNSISINPPGKPGMILQAIEFMHADVTVKLVDFSKPQITNIQTTTAKIKLGRHIQNGAVFNVRAKGDPPAGNTATGAVSPSSSSATFFSRATVPMLPRQQYRRRHSPLRFAHFE